jgi:hypothetical protein
MPPSFWSSSRWPSWVGPASSNLPDMDPNRTAAAALFVRAIHGVDPAGYRSGWGFCGHAIHPLPRPLCPAGPTTQASSPSLSLIGMCGFQSAKEAKSEGVYTVEVFLRSASWARSLRKAGEVTVRNTRSSSSVVAEAGRESRRGEAEAQAADDRRAKAQHGSRTVLREISQRNHSVSLVHQSGLVARLGSHRRS